MADSVGPRLRALRREKSLSQAKLAVLVNYLTGWTWHQTTVQKIEAGTRPISLDELDALASALGIPPVHLLTAAGDLAPSATRRRRELHSHLALLRQTRALLIEQHEAMLARFDKDIHAMEQELADLEKGEA